MSARGHSELDGLSGFGILRLLYIEGDIWLNLMLRTDSKTEGFQKRFGVLFVWILNRIDYHE